MWKNINVCLQCRAFEAGNLWEQYVCLEMRFLQK